MFERLLSQVARVIRQSLDMETISRRDGVLQRLDPRFVFIFLLSLVVVSVLLKNPLSIFLMIVLSLILAILSKVPLGWYLKRVWLFVPLFSVIILIPSMTNLVTRGEAFGPSVDLFGTTIYLTKQGLAYAVTFTLRVGAAVSLSILMVSTIGWSRLMAAMAQLKFPPSFVIILDMTYRYIHLLLDTVANMFMARKSRMVSRPNKREIREIGGSSVTNLFNKSYKMSENVYQAMISRGYTGKPRIMSDLRSNRIDVVFTIAVIGFATVVLVFDMNGSSTSLHNLFDYLGVWN
ncbi:MAG: cobalt ECF transporter T component CbiQ [Methanomassiliicoccales archaeon]|jgi:cobalt ECF transporter T component CbiQ